jgi:hypothetical protein
MRAARLSASMVLLATAFATHRAAAAPSVWMVDDGEKIRRDAVSTSFETGVDNAIWRPGEAAHLFAMRNESVAFQVVVEADDAELEGVTVEFDELDGPDGAKMVEGPPAVRGAVAGSGRIERFVEHFVEVRRASGGKKRGESPGWEAGSGPPEREWVGPVPDALLPVDVAHEWSPYPLRVAPRQNGIVWIDVEVPRAQAAGIYRGDVVVHVQDVVLARLPVELEVVDATLPDRTVATALSYDHEALEERVGPRAERQLWQLLHAHRIAPMNDATSPSDVDREFPSLSGSLYTASQGYVGPAPGMGDGVLAIGAHGAFGGPDAATLQRLRTVADRVADQKLLGATDVVLYAADDQCSSPWGAGWRSLLRDSDDANLRRVRVGWTCSLDPTAQPVDVPMMHATFDVAEVNAARAQGKESWVYDGVRPRTGTFLVDDDAVSPRVNGWLSAMFRIPRWVVRDSMHWYAEHGDVPIDPFADAESLSTESEWANGEGMLLYPGTQLDAFDEHSLGFQGVLASIRLKNWRRGLEDAGYLQMARDRDPARADAVARWLVPTAFDEAKAGDAPSWGSRGKPFFEARRELLGIILGRAPGVLPSRAAEPATVTAAMAGVGCSRGLTEAGGGIALGLVVGAMGLGRLRRRPHPLGPPPRKQGGGSVSL